MFINTTYTLIDVFIYKYQLVCWYKDNQGNDKYVKNEFKPIIYFNTFNEEFTRKILKNQHIEKITGHLRLSSPCPDKDTHQANPSMPDSPLGLTRHDQDG